MSHMKYVNARDHAVPKKWCGICCEMQFDGLIERDVKPVIGVISKTMRLQREFKTVTL